MSRIELNDKFYEDEIREGFYVPAAVKQAWGAEIMVLNEIDRVCQELGIKYFADWGTFLGAIRHGGFIPWDDDLDIAMLREDYDWFVKEGMSKLPEGFEVYNMETKPDHEKFLSNVVNKARMCFEPEHLEKFHGFPYIACVDIFIFDNVSMDADKQKAMIDNAFYILSISGQVRQGKIEEKYLDSYLDKIENITGKKINRRLRGHDLGQQLDLCVTELFKSFNGEDSDTIVQMMPFGMKGAGYIPRWYYSDSVDLPFETGTIPVPLVYDEAMKLHYGDYMKLYKNAGGHDYPFFDKSRKNLQEVLDFELPEYKVSTNEIIELYNERKNEKTASDNTYKAVVLECLNELKSLAKKIELYLVQIYIAVIEETVNELIGALSDLQQLTIDLGTYMETIKGEGYDLVNLLETFCDDIYKIAECIDGGLGEVKLNEAYENMISKLSLVEEKIILRKEALFLPFRADYWDMMKPEYDLAIEDENTDVYVIPIPYFYKNYDGTLRDMQYNPELYPKDVVITHYDAYDYEIHHPDRIYIQNPYDSYNEITSVPPFFYSDRLLKLTDELIYIPWFVTDDFDESNEREYKNMRYYCTMPGVVNADTVILNSENMKANYVNKLTEFAGDDTEYIWNEKIQVPPDSNKEDRGASYEYLIAYYIDFSDIVKYGQQAIEKIESSFEIFKKNADKPDRKFLLVQGVLMDEKLKEYDASIFDKYMELVERFGNTEQFFVRKLTNVSEMEEIVNICKAYYGDAGHLAHMFRNAGRPVMIQNYEVM